LCAAWLAVHLTPSHFVADDKQPVKLASMLPTQFAGWAVDPDQVALLVDPNVQKVVDSLYSQTLSRLYVNAKGQRIMLSIAYGRDQNSESTAAHRPEFCYSAQGFVVQKMGVAALPLTNHQISVMRLDARSGERREPITYWVTLGDNASLPGMRRKLLQLQYGLQGQILDGMLVRVSTVRAAIQPGSLDADFQLQADFLREMEKALAPEARSRFFGV
jgi:EpsI family protein